MTTTLKTLAAGLFGAAGMIGAAAAGPMAPINTSADQTGSLSETVSTSPDRVYCYSGVTGTPAAQSRGWVCQRESASGKR